MRKAETPATGQMTASGGFFGVLTGVFFISLERFVQSLTVFLAASESITPSNDISGKL